MPKKYYREVVDVNKAKCLSCGDIIESKHGHDFVWCSCKALAVDGGHNYLRRCFDDKSMIEEMSVCHQEERPAYDWELEQERKDAENGNVD